MKKMLLLFFIFSCFKGFCTDPSPMLFYKDLISSISNIQGTMYISLADGYWKKRINTAEIIWLNDANTVATFNFNYKSGNLQKDSYLAFSPSVHIWVRNSSAGLSLAVDTISFNSIGEFQGWKVHYDNLKGGTKNAPINPNEAGKIQAVLAADLRVNNFFNGNLFVNFQNPINVNDKLVDQPIGKSFLRKIYFLSSQNQPALNIDFNKGASLHFSKKNNTTLFDNSITLSRNNNSNAKFDYIKYDFENHTLEGRLSEFNANLDNGNLTSGTGIFLSLLPASSLSFNSLEFQNTDQFTFIDCTSGSLKAGIGAGSKINLTTDISNPSYIVVDNNSSISLTGFSFNIQDKKATNILISGGSSIQLNVRDAQFGIGSEGYIDLAAGQLNANLNGDWNSSRKPDADLQITNLNCTISGGRFLLNRTTDLSLVSGSIKSTDLLLKGLSFQGLTGKITDFNVFVQENSKFSLPNGMEIITATNNSSFIAATPTDPMILEQAYLYPISKYVLSFYFKTFQNSNSPIFGLQNGSIDIHLQTFDVDSIAISNSSISGQFAFSSKDARIRGLCSIYNINGYEVRGLPQQLGGKLKLNIFPGLSYDIHTDFKKGPGGDERNFPINLFASTHDSIVSSEGDIVFNGRVLNINNFNFNTALEVIVPAGKGEHQDKDDINSANGEHPGNDKFRTAQEVYFDNHTICQVHVYLLPYTYTFRSKFYIQSDASNNISLSLTQLSCDQPFVEDVNVGKDGCSGTVIGAVFGAIIGTLTGGAGGAIVFGIIGGVAGNDLESSIKARVLAEMANKIESEKGTWKLISF